jgi:hypothetical protein
VAIDAEARPAIGAAVGVEKRTSVQIAVIVEARAPFDVEVGVEVKAAPGVVLATIREQQSRSRSASRMKNYS